MIYFANLSYYCNCSLISLWNPIDGLCLLPRLLSLSCPVFSSSLLPAFCSFSLFTIYSPFVVRVEFVLLNVSCCCCKNFHELSGLKQHKLCYTSGGQRSRISFAGLKCIGSATFLLGGSRDSPPTYRFLDSRGHLHSWTCGPVSLQPLLLLSHLLWLFCLSLSLT